MMLMDRTTISLPPELHRKLRVMAADLGISMASLIREALDEKTALRKRTYLSMGSFASGERDLARRSADMHLVMADPGLRPEFRERLELIAAERGISVVALIRQTLEESPALRQPKPKSLGIDASDHTDISIRAGEERPVPRSWR
jgi:predicted DNA-binding ribbon-helix-helix protein